MVRVVAAIGRGFGGVLSEVGAIGLFVTKALSVGLSSFPNLRRTLEECYNIGIQSLFVVCSVGAFIGMSTALVGYATLRDLGAQNLVGIFIGIATVRELGPAVAAFMVAAKAGSGMAAHIATMRVKEQIDAMEVQAVNPFWYLIVPRFLAIMLVLPVLVIWNDFFMLGTGYLIAGHGEPALDGFRRGSLEGDDQGMGAGALHREHLHLQGIHLRAGRAGGREGHEPSGGLLHRHPHHHQLLPEPVALRGHRTARHVTGPSGTGDEGRTRE
jgi:hypothetical protein